MASRFMTKFEARPLSTPNLAPMIGVLLALFGGVAGLSGAAGATTPLELPPIASIYCGPPRHATVAVVLADGSLTLDGRLIRPDQLDAALAGLAAADRDLSVWARSDVDYGFIAPLVAAAGRAGVGVELIDERSYAEAPNRTVR
ncbi:hypothetical protein DDF62_04700 [Caulobacter radicis]|uniref:hypothetical protein n=1 Tax=Caulobacter radicis TaxID=2172650 RepID=UPI000D563692|nr:hypothetical protein [Caulobacter radicis]PVM92444.1 hypothetical protein DDF62_04700 [Caulobacter radicis]